MDTQSAPDRLVGLSCPECNGTLWELEDGNLIRFRCRVGHMFSPASLAGSQDEALERALWAARRALEESAALSRRAADRARERGQQAVWQAFAIKAERKEADASVLRKILEG